MGVGGVGGVGSSSFTRGIRSCLGSFSIKTKKNKSEASDVEAPFNEFNLSTEDIESMREELKETGLCKLKMSDATFHFLQQKIENDSSSQTYELPAIIPLDDHEDCIDKKEKLTSLVKRLVNDDELSVGNLQITKWDKRHTPSAWHINNKNVSLITTLRGKTTEYISPDEADKFTVNPIKKGLNTIMLLKDSNIDEIHKMEQGYFYFFLGAENNDDSFPKLIHRIPNDEPRDIFLADWSKN